MCLSSPRLQMPLQVLGLLSTWKMMVSILHLLASGHFCRLESSTGAPLSASHDISGAG